MPSKSQRVGFKLRFLQTLLTLRACLGVYGGLKVNQSFSFFAKTRPQVILFCSGLACLRHGGTSIEAGAACLGHRWLRGVSCDLVFVYSACEAAKSDDIRVRQ